MTPGNLPKIVAVPKSQKCRTSLLNSRNSEPSVLNHEIFYHSPKSNVHNKIPVKAKIPTAVFQCNFLGEFVFLATALTAFAMCIKHPTSSLKRPVCMRPSSSGFVPPKLTHISPFTANPAKFIKSRNMSLYFRVNSTTV